MAEEQKTARPALEASLENGNGTILERVRLEWKHYIYEFFIVALGISIPFLLDRWNQHIQDRHTERQYYVNLQQELAEDLVRIRLNMEYNTYYQSRYEKGSRIILESRRNEADTLGKIVFDIRYFSDFHRNSKLYETLAQSGELPLIRNREILARLQGLEERYTYLNRSESNHFDVIMRLAAPELVSRLRIEPFEVIDPEWLFGYQCHNLLLVFISLCEEKGDIYVYVEQLILELQELLEKELE